jgi:hypothetical protein
MVVLLYLLKHFGESSTCLYTQKELAYNTRVLESYSILLLTVSVIQLLKFESQGRYGCWNKTRRCIFMCVRTALIMFYLYWLISLMCWLLPTTW